MLVLSKRCAKSVLGLQQLSACSRLMRPFAGHVRGLTLLLGSMAAGLTEHDSPYSGDGPCGVLPGVDYNVLADTLGSRNSQRKLRVTVTLPAHPAEALSSLGQISRTSPHPVIFFFSGFLVRTSQHLPNGFCLLPGHRHVFLQLKPAYYTAYANRLASWGYAVVQYDTGRWPILNDRQEVPSVLPMPSQICKECCINSVTRFPPSMSCSSSYCACSCPFSSS